MWKKIGFGVLVVALMFGVVVSTAQAESTVIQPVSVTIVPNGDSYLQFNPHWIDGSGLTDATIVETGDIVPDPWPEHISGYNNSRIERIRNADEFETLTFDLGGAFELSGMVLWNSTEAGQTERGFEHTVLSYSTDGGSTFIPGETLTWIERSADAAPNSNTTATFAPEVQMLAGPVPGVTHVRMMVDNFSEAGANVIILAHEIRFIAGTDKPAAHSPSPENLDDQVDSAVVSQLTWEGPLTQSDVDGDPNLVSVDQFDLTIYSKQIADVTPDDPNFDTNGVTYTDVESPFAISLDFDTTYFWRVDTHITWDSNEFTGTASTSEVVEGSIWQFSTLPEYLVPVIDSLDSGITLVNLSVTLNGAVSGNSEPITSTLTLLENDYQFPAGATVTFSDNTTDPAAPTCEFASDTTGTYKIKLTVNDGTTVLEQVAEVVVYADACEAKKNAPSGWTAEYFDVDGSCVVDLSDFAAFALKWLDFTGMTAPETYEGGDIYTLLDVDFYVEGENPYSFTDPNYVINAPLTPLPNPATGAGGPHIGSNDVFSGGKFIGWTDPNDYIVYAVDVPTAGDYTVMLVNTFNSDPGTVRKAALGTVSPDGDPSNDDQYAYGEITLADGSGNYATPKIDSTTVNFPTAGTHLIRVTWKGGNFNLDFLAIKKAE